MFISGLVGWLIQELGEAGLRRLDRDPVMRALEQAVRDAVRSAAVRLYDDPAVREHTISSLLECPALSLPGVDAVPLTQLRAAVRLWVAALDSPIGEDGLPEHVGDHPLVGPLCGEILQAIQQAATYGDRVLHPVWSDYCQAVDTQKVLAEIQNLRRALKEELADAQVKVGGRVSPPSGYVRPERIDYWQPPVVRGTGFVGREEELAKLSGTAGAHPVHLIHGVGGCGKTALAVEYANRLADRYPDGRVFLDFHSYSPEAHHAPKIAEWVLAELLPHCGLERERVSGMTLAELETAWKQAIAGRRMMFAWDNVGDLAQVQPLLTGQAGCITIITSRSELDLGGDSLALGPLAPTDAHELFATIAGEDRCRDYPGLVEEAARLCARMPLQIRVHASRVRRMRTLPELVNELRTLPSEQRLLTLFASLDLSYHSLSPEERLGLRVLGAHPGPYLAGGTAAAMLDCPVGEAVRLLDQLVEANLCDRYRGRFDRYHGGVEVPPAPEFYSYVLHEVLRDYAYHKASADADEYQHLMARLIGHYRTRTLPPEVTPAWVQTERASLLACLALNLPAGSVLSMALDVGNVLTALGWYSDAQTAYEFALSRSWTANDRASEAEALHGLANCALIRGEAETARPMLRAARMIYQETGDQRAEARILGSLALGESFSSLTAGAERYMREALDVWHELGDRREEAGALRALVTYATMENPAAPDLRKRLAELLRLARELKDRRLEAGTLLDLGTLHDIRGEPSRGREALQNAYKLFTAEKHRHGQANALYALGKNAIARGDYDRADRHLREAVAIYREISDGLGEIKSVISLGELAHAQDDQVGAMRCFREAAGQSQRLDNKVFLAMALEGQAMVAMWAGDRAAGCALLREALVALSDVGRSAQAAQIRELLERYRCGG